MTQAYEVHNMNDTIPLMVHEDYKARMVAEYMQTKIRYNRLHRLIVKIEADTVDFEPSCPLSLLREQAEAMGKYLHALEIRMELEKVVYVENL